MELLHVGTARLGCGDLINADDLDRVRAGLVASAHLTVYRASDPDK